MDFKNGMIAKRLKKIDFLYQPYKKWRISSTMKRRVRALHSEGYGVLFEICSTLNRESILGFCAFGTLLGIVRDKDFIQSDSDIDFGILPSDNFSWLHFERIMGTMGLKRLHQFSDNYGVFEQTYYKGDILVDFFLYRKHEDGLVTSVCFKDPKIMYSTEREYSIMYRFSPRIDNLIQYKFKDSSVTVPENYENYLETVYGNAWRIPDPGYRYENEKNVAVGVFAYEEI